jgi:hypothetical protein
MGVPMAVFILKAGYPSQVRGARAGRDKLIAKARAQPGRGSLRRKPTRSLTRSRR